MVHEYICQDLIKHEKCKERSFYDEEIVARSLQHAVVVLFAVESIDLLDDSLLHLDTLSTRIRIPAMSAQMKIELLEYFLSKENIKLPSMPNESEDDYFIVKWKGLLWEIL